MTAKARIFGLPVHQILIVFPLGLLATSFFFDLAYLAKGRAELAIVASWLIFAGVIGGGAASLFGYAFVDGTSDEAVAFVLTYAAGAILTMLANTMMPEAYDKANKNAAVGVAKTLGFGVAFAIHMFS